MSPFPWKLKLYNRNPLGDDLCNWRPIVCQDCSPNSVPWFPEVFFSSTHYIFYSITDRLSSCDMLKSRGMISRVISRPQKVILWEEWLTIFALDVIQRYSSLPQSQLCATSQRPVPVTTAPGKWEAPYYSHFRQYISSVCLWVPFQKLLLHFELRRCLQLTNTQLQNTRDIQWTMGRLRVISGTSAVPRNKSGIHCKTDVWKSVLNNALGSVTYKNVIHLHFKWVWLYNSSPSAQFYFPYIVFSVGSRTVIETPTLFSAMDTYLNSPYCRDATVSLIYNPCKPRCFGAQPVTCRLRSSDHGLLLVKFIFFPVCVWDH